MNESKNSSDFYRYIDDILLARYQDSVIKRKPDLPNSQKKPDYLVYGPTMKGKPAVVLVRNVPELHLDDIVEAAELRNLANGSQALIFVTGDTRVAADINDASKRSNVLVVETPWCEPAFH